MAMESQLINKNATDGFAANRRGDRREEICPNGTDHPGHRLIYMGPT
jgi:hypothetical protein